MSRQPFPYETLSSAHSWKAVYRDPAVGPMETQGSTKFKLTQGTPIASAGSDFARLMAEDMRRRGLTCVDTGSEQHLLASAPFGYAPTIVQFEQLLLRALGRFKPIQDSWSDREGGLFDPFCPSISPNGFASAEALRAARQVQFETVLRSVAESHAVILTPSLTEAWADGRDGAVFPVAPGRGRGTIDPTHVGFVNFSVAENSDSIQRAFGLLREINPRLRLIVAVSPIPLEATQAGPHVLRATIHSKSVLRIAVEMLARSHDDVDYFACYELITAGGFRPPYFESNGATLTTAGVGAVMHSFYAHYFDLAN